MNRRTTILIPALGLALFLANFGQVAEAGYVSSGLECVRGDATPVDLSQGASAISDESARPVDEVKIELSNRHKAKLSRAPADFGPSSGMSPPDSEGSANQPDLVGPKNLPVGGLPMAEWLGAEGRAALPPPLSTGIFRPPRFLG
jgi:hypothetical protein